MIEKSDKNARKAQVDALLHTAGEGGEIFEQLSAEGSRAMHAAAEACGLDFRFRGALERAITEVSEDCIDRPENFVEEVSARLAGEFGPLGLKKETEMKFLEEFRKHLASAGGEPS